MDRLLNMATDLPSKQCAQQIWKENVKLALQVFDRQVTEGLMVLCEHNNIPYFRPTSYCLKIISTWWSIVNINSIKRLP